MIQVPNLDFESALRFSQTLNTHSIEENETFDFSRVTNCDPFPMLLASAAIRQQRGKSCVKHCIASNCNNTYAEHMRFYRATGIALGRNLDENYGNSNYLPITKLDVKSLREDGIRNLERIQVVLERKSRQMAIVLSRGNTSFANWLSYVLLEMMRNIPEHSEADSIWYCAQYWPRHDLVELAILDEGRGIKNSFLSNSAYTDSIKDDIDALNLALEPGVSRTFAPGSCNIDNDEWKNSGYGIYMVSNLCDRLGGSFIIASGNSATLLRSGQRTTYDCHLQGTGIQIRIRPSRIGRYKEIAQDILNTGEQIAKNGGNRIVSASKSTRSLFTFED
ncbi:MAG: hypothetical protein IJZ55_08895 [Lachnospiraceae bacterium]|nr:hypothetical protein [Lachnospiraceae bacterium]